MTMLQTMGTSSCATIALGFFKRNLFNKEWGGSQKDLNELYKEDPVKFFKTYPIPSDGDVEDFYIDIIYPTIQELGKTADLPFEYIMEKIDEGEFKNKFIIATLNEYQQGAEGYWPRELERWGFECVDKTNNDIGGMNYIYTRNKGRPDA